MLTLLLGATVAAAVCFYYYISKLMRYWQDRGIDSGNPKWLFGHYWESCLGKKNVPDIIDTTYKQNPNARYTGIYRFWKPILLLRDPELIKQITIKDFNSFTDHLGNFIPEDQNPLWSKNLLCLSGLKWKESRNHLSPSFTSSKIRGVFKLMVECAEDLVQYLQKQNQEVVTIELTDLFSRYTNDVIASTVFGLKVNSLVNRDNEFYRMAKEVADFLGIKKFLTFLMYWCIPPIKYVIKIQVFSDKVSNYFRGIIKHAIKAREENGIIRQDMLQLFIEARKSAQNRKKSVPENISDSGLNDDDLTAHAISFSIGGFETVSSLICFSTYELAINPDVQETLRSEVLDTLEKCKGRVTYEALLEMKYLDMVVSESLRKWTHFTMTDRVCTKPYTIEPVMPGEKPLHLEIGQEIYMPIYSIHHDPKYFPDPDRFDPERFSGENKAKIHPASYLPFGIGPRKCIGSRFTLLEAKILLFWLLTKFEVVPVEKTQVPLRFSKRTIATLKPEDGFWCGFKLHKK